MSEGCGSLKELCVYCLSAFPPGQLTEDHVIAKSWYPANTPPVQKWKVPACEDCNNRYSKFESELLWRLALCANPEDPALLHIIQKAKRSFDPKAGKSARDMVSRLNRRLSLRHKTKTISDPDGPGILPSFRENYALGSSTGILIPGRLLRGVVRKWIRGVHYCELGRIANRDFEVSVQVVEDEVAMAAFGKITKFAKQIHKGPGVEVLIWEAEEDSEHIAQYAFKIWENFRVYGSVEKTKNAAKIGN